MAGHTSSLRVAMYSHDTFGLGHITRTLRLARATVEAVPNASVLVLTGSPIAHRLTFPRGVEYVKLPSVRKRGPEKYVPRELGIPFWRLRHMRMRILRDAMRVFRPHILFVDNVPLGMRGEILPSLEDLKKYGATLHLNLRDILDEPGVVRSQWAEDGTHEILNSLYDEIHVFGDRSIHDSVAEYGLPAAKTLFHGYIPPPAPVAREHVLPVRRRNGIPYVLVTIGGGEDGAEVLLCLLEAERGHEAVRRLRFDVVLGPLMRLEEAEGIRAAAGRKGGVSVCEFVEDLADFMPEYDLVVSMGGYNTLCEVMTKAHRSLVIPRTYPRREQELRARALEGRGILRVLHPGDLTPERFGAALSDSLESGPILPSPRAPRLEGVRCFKKRLVEIAPSLPEPAPPRRNRTRESATPGERARRLVRSGVIGLGMAALLFGSAGLARAGLRPKAVNAEMLVGYDTNVLDASDAEIRAFETHDPGSFFVVDHMKDAALQMSVDGRWGLALPGRKTDVRLRYTRLQYLRETIRCESHYSLLWRSRVDSNTQTDFSLEFAPKVYARHRRDKDALPGDPVFRAEVRNEWDAALQLTRALGPRWSSVSVVEGSIRDYTQPFNERDRWRLGGRTGFAWQLARSARLDLSGGYRRVRSRNLPYLGSDLSTREWSLRSAFDCPLLGGFRARAYANRDWTHYTSDDPDDQNHFGRQDDEWEFGGLLQHALSHTLDWKATIAHMRRSAETTLASNGDLDEEGSIRDTFVSTGFAWHWQP